MAAPPFLKSNRVEDIRSVLAQLYRTLGLSSASSVASPTSGTSATETYVLPTGTAKKGDKGDNGDPGKNAVSTVTVVSESFKEFVYGRSTDQVPLSLSSGDLLSDHRGYLVTVRSSDEVLLVDGQNEVITE